MLFPKDASGANTMASADIGKSKNHVVKGGTTKSLNMKVAILVVP